MKMHVDFEDIMAVEEFVRAWAPVFRLGGSATLPDQAANATPQAQPPVQTAPVQVTPVQVAPIVPTQTTPVQPPAQAVQQPIQTTAVTYKLDDLARAAMTLMDTGRQVDLQQMLFRFGVQSLPELPPAQYGAFATELRAMGAQI